MTDAVEWDQGHIFLKHVDKTGSVYYTEHRCWHIGRFMSMANKAETDVGTKLTRVSAKEYERATGRKA